MDHPTLVSCRFHRRTQNPAGYLYEPIIVDGPAAEGHLVTAHPPPVGDRIFLTDALTRAAGTYRVIERGWSYAEYGSMHWPVGQTRKAPPRLDIIVEASEGLFRDEADVTQDAPA